jgi:spore coat polysaccharide biosynthesis protein SpsF
VNQIVVATSGLPQDAPIVEFCAARGICSFTGSHDDVLDRFARALKQEPADIVVRITADCPLLEPSIVDRVIAIMLNEPGLDAASNVFPLRTFPRGLDVEALTADALRRLDASVSDMRLREHVTLPMYENATQFRLGSVFCDQDWSRIRWTVDEPADLQLVRQIYAAFGLRSFGWVDCLRAYRNHPQWLGVNSHVEQKVA